MDEQYATPWKSSSGRGGRPTRSQVSGEIHRLRSRIRQPTTGTVISDRRNRPTNYATTSSGKVVDEESGRRAWDDTISTIKLSLMKTGIFRFPTNTAGGSPQSGDGLSPERQADADDRNTEARDSEIDPSNSTK